MSYQHRVECEQLRHKLNVALQRAEAAEAYAKSLNDIIDTRERDLRFAEADLAAYQAELSSYVSLGTFRPGPDFTVRDGIQTSDLPAIRIVDKLHAAEAKLADLEKQKLAAEVKLYRQESIIPEGLNRCTAELVLDFAKDLAEKLYRSEQKYGWSDGWKESDWQEKCLADFHHHISKGDPRDVAAYCAFMWHHEWPTRPAPSINLAELVPDEMNPDHPKMRWVGMDELFPKIEGWNDCRAAIIRNIEEANK